MPKDFEALSRHNQGMTHPTLLHPSGTRKRSRTETFEHTINGLLTKRAVIFTEAETLRDRQTEITGLGHCQI